VIARLHAARLRSALLSWMTRPAALPIGLALLAVALLGGVAGTAVHEGNDAAQREAQVRMRSNRDAAVRALVRQSDDFRRSVATWAVNPALVEGLRAPSPAGLVGAQNELAIFAGVHGSPGGIHHGSLGKGGCDLPLPP